MPFSHRDAKALNKILKSRNIKTKEGWNNFSKNLSMPKARVIEIETLDDLIAIVKEIYKRNQNKAPKDRILYRAMAGGKDEKYSESFSLTPCGEADIVFNLVGEKFSQVKWFDKNKNQVKVGPSIQVGALDKTLYYDFGLMPKHSPSLIERVTRAGLMANGGHGTGLDSSGYSANAIKFCFLLENGEFAWLDKYDEKGNENPLFKELAPAHLGNLGIEVGAILECQPAQKYRCVKKAMSLPEFLEKTKKGLFSKPLVSAMYAPTYQHDLTNRDINNVVVYSWEPVPLEEEDKNFDPLWREIKQWFQVELAEGLDVTDFLSEVPEIIPYYMQYIVGPNAIGSGKTEIVGPYPEVYHYQVEYPHKLNDFDCLYEISPDGHEIVDTFTKLAEKTQEQADKGEYAITYAAYVRVFDGEGSGLSPAIREEGKKVAGFDVVSSPNLAGFEELREFMVNYLVKAYKAKLHWGKYVPDNIDYEEMYGEQMVKYKEALALWYISNGLLDKSKLIELRKDPSFNDFIIRISQLPADQYKAALKEWYENSNLVDKAELADLKHNPALNNFFCNILKMPEEMTPAPIANTTDGMRARDVCTPEKKAKMAKSFLSMVEGKPGTEDLCKKLGSVIKRCDGECEAKKAKKKFSLFSCLKSQSEVTSPTVRMRHH